MGGPPGPPTVPRGLGRRQASMPTKAARAGQGSAIARAPPPPARIRQPVLLVLTPRPDAAPAGIGRALPRRLRPSAAPATLRRWHQAAGRLGADKRSQALEFAPPQKLLDLRLREGRLHERDWRGFDAATPGVRRTALGTSRVSCWPSWQQRRHAGCSATPSSGTSATAGSWLRRRHAGCSTLQLRDGRLHQRDRCGFDAATQAVGQHTFGHPAAQAVSGTVARSPAGRRPGHDAPSRSAPGPPAPPTPLVPTPARTARGTRPGFFAPPPR